MKTLDVANLDRLRAVYDRHSVGQHTTNLYWK